MLDTITREQLIEATELTLERAAEGTEIPDDLAARVREVAQTATRITASWWSEEHQCGCLIGTLLGPDALAILEQMEDEQGVFLLAEDQIACTFPGSLYQVAKTHSYNDAYEVID